MPVLEEPGLVARFTAHRTLIKVPEIAVLFWVAKLLTTAGGESIADLLSIDLIGMKPSLLITTVLLASVLGIQLSLRRYLALVYWGAVALVGIAGTLLTDYLVQSLGISELGATLMFGTALLVVFGVWYRLEGTLSFHSITTTRREIIYWTAVLVSFALGTAAGDLTAFTLGWGFIRSAVLYGAMIIAVGVAFLRFGLNPVACFWLAYVCTRPMGASIADYLAFDHDLGGLALGLAPVSAFFAVAIVGLIGYLMLSGIDVPEQCHRNRWLPPGSGSGAPG